MLWASQLSFANKHIYNYSLLYLALLLSFPSLFWLKGSCQKANMFWVKIIVNINEYLPRVTQCSKRTASLKHWNTATVTWIMIPASLWCLAECRIQSRCSVKAFRAGDYICKNTQLINCRKPDLCSSPSGLKLTGVSRKDEVEETTWMWHWAAGLLCFPTECPMLGKWRPPTRGLWANTQIPSRIDWPWREFILYKQDCTH